ncbi:MAG: flippase-like domain-containing protein [Ardenticatenaceae bacterium]|nr:flippase-like domain-containing protein [Anaerolineales bacterium]MCB8938377.1 flippase-like domain-containing protein [Ardenticatenaceae bacterium]MCB8975313.1 flippase-like domain-containing protein [Ardenticatenaceae bacterium]
MSRKQIWQIVGLLVVIGAIVALFVWFVDLQAVGEVLSTAVPTHLILASVLLILGLLFYALRWQLLLGNKPTLLQTFHASNIGHAGNIIVPARAGEAMRIVVLGRSEAVTYTEATSSFVVERLFEQLMRLLALVAAVAVGAGIELSPGSILGGVAVLVLTFGGIQWLVRRRERVLARWPARFARLPRITEDGARRTLTDLLDNLTAVSEPKQLAKVMGSSLLSWGCFWGFFYVTLLALGQGFPPDERLAVSLGALALSPPSAPTQPGIFHASVVVPLAAVGFNEVTLTAYAVLLHILEMVWMIGLALWGLAQTGLSVGAMLRQNQPATDRPQ